MVLVGSGTILGSASLLVWRTAACLWKWPTAAPELCSPCTRGRFLGGCLTNVDGRDEMAGLLSLVFGDCVQSNRSAEYP